jgi:hypothetical protein
MMGSRLIVTPANATIQARRSNPQHEQGAMSVFTKLNLKDHREIVVLNAPESFAPELARLSGVTVLRSAERAPPIRFALAFVKTQVELNAAAEQILPRTEGDAVVWFAYPKASSKRYRCDFNRDTGWDALGRAGFEGVRQVAIDEDWSALRFRRVEYVKTMKRDASHALSEQGRARTRKE